MASAGEGTHAWALPVMASSCGPRKWRKPCTVSSMPSSRAQTSATRELRSNSAVLLNSQRFSRPDSSICSRTYKANACKHACLMIEYCHYCKPCNGIQQGTALRKDGGP